MLISESQSHKKYILYYVRCYLFFCKSFYLSGVFEYDPGFDQDADLPFYESDDDTDG